MSDIRCPKCGGENLHRLENKKTRHHGEVTPIICRQCGEEFGTTTEENSRHIKDSLDRLRMD